MRISYNVLLSYFLLTQILPNPLSLFANIVSFDFPKPSSMIYTTHMFLDVCLLLKCQWLFTHSPPAANCPNTLARWGHHGCLLSPCMILCSLNLYRSCTNCHNCDFIRAAASPLCLENNFFVIIIYCLWLLQSFHCFCYGP